MKKAISLVLSLIIAMTCCINCIAGESGSDYDFKGFNDAGLYDYLEAEIYQSLIDEFDDSEIFIENISTTYISEEYLEEVAYNSKANIYFGYNLADLEDVFQGTKYVFALDEDGATTVKEFEEYDDTFDQVLRNVAVGTGVILVCVTVSVVTAGAGAAAISVIFATAAEAGTVGAVTGGVFSGVTAGVIKGIETGDANEALKAAALAGSEGFKWGAITGAISGGAGEAIALKGATESGLTMNEVAIIQKESKYPLDVIKTFKSMDQYQICKDAGLTPHLVDGKMALIRDIDLDFVDDLGRTNLQRMQEGLAALDPTTGQAFELHHIGQEMDSTLAILSKAEHMQGGNNEIWHELGEASKIDRSVFDKQRASFWKTMATLIGG